MKYTTLHSYRRRLIRVLLHIEANLHGPLDLKRLAEIANYSPYHFHHAFQSVLQTTPGKYVQERRLAMAESILRNTRMSIGDTAYACGYKDATAFSRAFRKRFGISPRTYQMRPEEIEIPPLHLVNGRSHATRHQSKDGYEGWTETLPTMLIACVHQEEPCSFEEEGFIFLARILKECNLRPGFPLMVTVADVATDSVSWSPQRYRCGVTIHPHLGEVTNLKHDRIASGTYAGAHFNGAMHTEANAYEWIVQDFLPRNGLKRRDGPVLHTSLVLQQPESLNLYSSDLFVPVVATK